MIKEICKDVFLLGKKASPATKADIPVADDLLETLEANKERCVGMAANMIGVPKAIIVFTDEAGAPREMFNPEYTSRMMPYDTEEGCLSHAGTRKTKRYGMISVRYQTREMKWKKESFTGFTAQIIQHEMDHLMGVII